MKIGRQGWSERLEKQVVRLATRESFGEAVKTYAELTGFQVLKTTAWERLQERGERLKKRREQEAIHKWGLPKRSENMPGEAQQSTKKAISVDGAMVYIVGEEWKEVKIGCVFEYETRLEYSRKKQEREEVVKGRNQSYTACLGGTEPFGKLLAAEADRCGFYRAWDQVVVADGAKWIWNLSATCCPEAQEIVDWGHAMRHVWTAAHLFYAEGSVGSKRWVKDQEEALWNGQVYKVMADIQALGQQLPGKAPELQTEAGYFQNNARRMRYQEFREEGYPIGSGTVESGCKRLVEQRMRGAGMHWSRPGAENMLALRVEYLSQRWDEAWQLTLAF